MRDLVRVLFLALLLPAPSALIFGQGKSAADYRRCVFSVMLPDYPQEAREKKWTGVGSAAMQIDSGTGRVQSVTLTKSTGHGNLDEAALRAYKRWVFLPHTISHAEVPIIFNRFGPVDPTSETVSHPAVVSSAPVEYPTAALRNHITGSGTIQLDIDNNGMVVNAVMIQSTGHRILDDAAIRSYRAWQFRPGTPRKVKIPVRFVMDKKPW